VRTSDDGACGGSSRTRRTEEASEDREGGQAIQNSKILWVGGRRHVLEGDLVVIAVTFLLFQANFFLQVPLNMVLEGDFRGYRCG
jgi:hypothetical protein